MGLISKLLKTGLTIGALVTAYQATQKTKKETGTIDADDSTLIIFLYMKINIFKNYIFCVALSYILTCKYHLLVHPYYFKNCYCYSYHYK